jgi:Transglycosylase
MRTKKDWTFLILKATALIAILAIVCIYFFRDTLLQQVIVKAENIFKTDYNATFSVGKAKFEGTSSISLDDINIIPFGKDTLLSVEKITTEISLLQIITGDIQLKNLEMKNGFIHLVKDKNGRNFDAFLKKDSNEEISNEQRNYAKIANRILTKLFNLFPSKMNLDNLSLRLNDMGKKTTFHLYNLKLQNEQLDTKIHVTTATFAQNWNIKGYANPREKRADITLVSADTTKIQVPYIDEKFGLKSSFNKIRMQLNRIEMGFTELEIEGIASIENLSINHPKIAKKDVVISKALFDYKFRLGSDFISLDNTSSAQLNKIKVKPYLEYNTEEDTLYKLKLNIPKMKAQDFIESLPTGLFTHFEGMNAKGEFDFALNFEFNKNKPHKIVFDSKFNKNNLQIVKYGKADLEKLNTEFTYSAIENGRPQRPIFIGNSNPYYTPLDSISSYLKNAVLTSEDPSFMHHKGFISEAFKQSIAKNIRTKKFARGASTISMQLVKNVFLTREKTLSRKLEEILLVYILENNRIASKERMLEVYFNVIEFGPDVYGIGEAAEFYFQKKPKNLSLNECLFLASIVPKPKKFMYQFNDEGLQKSYAEKNQKFIKNLMLRRALITPEDTIGQSIPITISGRARSLLKLKVVQDSISVDSLNLPETEFFNEF